MYSQGIIRVIINVKAKKTLFIFKSTIVSLAKTNFRTTLYCAKNA